MRLAFIETLCEIAATRDDIVLVCGDLGFSVLESFAQRFPDRFFNAGVAEQNMMGVAAGMAACGKTVLTYSIANFALVRCFEQFRNDACYHNLPVIAVSVGAGVAYGAQGYTHHGIEDAAFTRILPNVAVASPGDPAETKWALQQMIARGRPASLRLGRGGEPAVHTNPIDAALGSGLLLRPPGTDLTIICSGSPLPEARQAAERLADMGLDVGLISMPFLTPLDHAAITDAARKSSIVLTVEEHVRDGGLGGAVAEVIAGLLGQRACLIRAGLSSISLKTAADQREIRRLNGFDADGLVAQYFAAAGKAEPTGGA